MLPVMALTVDQRIEKIQALLRDDRVKTIVLEGVTGIGKTWTARKICDQESNGLFDITLWLFLNRKYDDWDLFENIAYQLSLLSTMEEKEDDYRNKEMEGEEVRLGKLKQKISAALANKRCLLILDDEGKKMNEGEIMSKMLTLLPPDQRNEYKVLITRQLNVVNIDKQEIRASDNTSDGAKTVIGFELLPEEASLQLLRERLKRSDSELGRFESQFGANNSIKGGLPAAILVIAEVLKYLLEHEGGEWTFESALEELAYNENYHQTKLLRSLDMLPITDIIDFFWHSRQFFRVNGGVHYHELITYWILEGYLGDVDHIENTYRRGHFVLMELVKHGLLIKQEDSVVAMEGALLDLDDHHHHGFFETTSLGLAIIFEDGKWKDLGLGKTTWIDGMVKSLSYGDNWQGLLLDGNRLCREVPDSLFNNLLGLQVLTLFNPRLKSVPLSLSKLQKLLVLVLRGCYLLETVDDIRVLKTLTVLEISGASSLEKIPDDVFEQMPNLQSLNLSDNQIESLPTSIFSRSQLRCLILRKCSRVETLPTLKDVGNLEVLDLSGATSLKSIKDRRFFTPKLLFLDLSQTQIERLPFVQSLEKLTRLLLSGCSRLSRLPKLTFLKSLRILDASGAINLKEIQDDFLDNEVLITLNLSGSAISRFASKICDPCNLYLKDCSELRKLPSTVNLKKLELIDLSGAAALYEIEDRSFEHLRFLRHLNLSKTNVKCLPILSNLGCLRQLLLKDCSLLEALPEMDGLTRLEVLDLSGASALKEIKHLNHRNLRHLLLQGCSELGKLPQMVAVEKLEVLDLSGCKTLVDIEDKSFQQMTCLARLDVSGTKIKSLPSCPSNLSHLLLRDCRNLEKLPPRESLSKLEELDIRGAVALEEIQIHFFEHMDHLRILNLSEIPQVRLLSMAGLPKLRELSVGGCSELETIQQLEVLTELEILDLSGTKIRSLPSLNLFSNLRKLLLRGCSNINGLIYLESLCHLEVLDLFRTGIKEFPYEISELISLKQVALPEMKDFEIKWEKIKCLPEKLNWEECGIPKLAESLVENSKPSITVTGTELFIFLRRNRSLWETCFKQFHFSVRSPGYMKDGDIFWHRYEFLYQDIFTQARKFPFLNNYRQSLEIRGFQTLPTGIEDVLRCVEFLLLVENEFLSSLYDLAAENIKGCWIERCNEMEYILAGEEKHGRLGDGLEILCVSNMTNLKSLWSEEWRSERFKNLKQLYLDCCPMVVNVFSSSQVPENLEILQIKFCDKVESVFGDQVVTDYVVQKLRTLDLLELPELKSIGGILPSLQILKVRECPNLPNLEKEVDLPRNLQSESFKNLKELYLDGCSMLVSVFSSLHQPINLEIVQIEFCHNLETLFEADASSKHELPNLRSLHLWNLPKLKSVGEGLPSQLTREVWECPKLELPPVL